MIQTINIGFFPTSVVACFTKKEFYKILKENGVPENMFPDIVPLERGLAETHAFNMQGAMFVIVIFNMDLIGDDLIALAGIAAHETVHVVERVFEHIGEDIEDIGEETRAYLLQHIVEQLFSCCLWEMQKHAKRKSNRKTSGKAGKAEKGLLPEVDKPQHDGGPGSDSPVQQQDSSGRVEGREGDPVATPEVVHKTDGGDWHSGTRTLH